jgi:hypothetical protein
VFNPKFINPPQHGTELFRDVARVPAHFRVIGADPKTPEGQALLAQYRALIHSFYVRQSHNHSLSGLSQGASSVTYGGVEMRYLNQFGVETVYVDFSVAPKEEKEEGKVFEINPGFIFFHDAGWEYKEVAPLEDPATGFKQAGLSSSTLAFDYAFPDATYGPTSKDDTFDSTDPSIGFPGIYSWYSSDGTSTIQIPFSARGDDNNPYTTTVDNVVTHSVKTDCTGIFVNGVYMFAGVHDICGAAVRGGNTLIVVYFETEQAYDDVTDIYYDVSYYSVRVFSGVFTSEPDSSGVFTPIPEIEWGSGRDILKQKLEYPYEAGYTCWYPPAPDTHTDFYQALFSQYFFHFSPDASTCSRVTHVYPRERCDASGENPRFYTSSHIHTINIPADLSEEAAPTVTEFSPELMSALEGVSSVLRNGVKQSLINNWPDNVVTEYYTPTQCTSGDDVLTSTDTLAQGEYMMSTYIDDTQSLIRPLCCGYNNAGELRILCATKTIGPGTYASDYSEDWSFTVTWESIGYWLNPGGTSEECGWIQTGETYTYSGGLSSSASYYHDNTWGHAIYDGGMVLLADLDAKVGQVVYVPTTTSSAYFPGSGNATTATVTGTTVSGQYVETTYMQLLGVDLRAGVAFVDKSKVNTVTAGLSSPSITEVVSVSPVGTKYWFAVSALVKAAYVRRMYFSPDSAYTGYVRSINTSISKSFRTADGPKEQLFFYEPSVSHTVDLDFVRNEQESSSSSSSIADRDAAWAAGDLQGTSRYALYTTHTTYADEVQEGYPPVPYSTWISVISGLPEEYIQAMLLPPWSDQTLSIGGTAGMEPPTSTSSYVIDAELNVVSPRFMSGPPSWDIYLKAVYESWETYWDEYLHNNMLMYQGVTLDKHILLSSADGKIIVAPSFRNQYARFDATMHGYNVNSHPLADGQQVVYMDQVYAVSPGTDEFGNPAYTVLDISDTASFSPAGGAFLTDDVSELGKASYEVWATFWGFVPAAVGS